MSQMIFEKLAALLFLLLLVGMVMFLVFVPLPLASEKVVLMIELATVKESNNRLLEMLVKEHIVKESPASTPRLPKP